MELRRFLGCGINKPAWVPNLDNILPRMTLFMLKLLIGISIVHFIFCSVFPERLNINYNYFIIIIGSIVVTLAAFFLISNYQALLQDFILKSDKIEKHINERTDVLMKLNVEMKQEIVERKRIESALAESEARLRTIIKESVLGIALIDMKGRLVEWNPALETILGYSKVELNDAEFSLFNHPDDAFSCIRRTNELLKGKRNAFHIENRYVSKNGRTGWWRQSVSLVRTPGGHPQFIIALIEDVTQRKQTEAEIQKYQERLRSLASELSLTEERERRNLAVMLHDQIGQMLSFARIKLEEAQDSKPLHWIKDQIMEAYRLIENSIRVTRSLIFELSPPILYDLGFEAAVEWLAENTSKQNNLQVQMVNDDKPKPLSDEKKIVLFRAVRELLFNVIKHAKATQVTIYIRREGDVLQISVVDDGIGFPAQKVSDQKNGLSGGYGLFSIEERMQYYGGKLVIESKPEINKVSLIIPVDEEVKNKLSDNLSGAALDEIHGS